MNYLGHYEFGQNHQPWFKPIKFNDTDNINYWLEQWYLFYIKIIDEFKLLNNCHLICYEKLCANENYKNELIEKIKITNEKLFKFDLSKKNTIQNFDKDLLYKCNELYSTMVNLWK